MKRVMENFKRRNATVVDGGNQSFGDILNRFVILIQSTPFPYYFHQGQMSRRRLHPQTSDETQSRQRNVGLFEVEGLDIGDVERVVLPADGSLLVGMFELSCLDSELLYPTLVIDLCKAIKMEGDESFKD